MRKEILDYVRGLNQLTKDTGVIVHSFDFSEPILALEGNLYTIEWNKKKEEYTCIPCGKPKYKAYGDVNPLEHGGQWIKKTSEYDYCVVTVDKVEDQEDLLRVGVCCLDPNDSWIDINAVESCCDTPDSNKERFALDVVSYYGAEQCGGCYSQFNRETTIEFLKNLKIEVK